MKAEWTCTPDGLDWWLDPMPPGTAVWAWRAPGGDDEIWHFRADTHATHLADTRVTYRAGEHGSADEAKAAAIAAARELFAKVGRQDALEALP